MKDAEDEARAHLKWSDGRGERRQQEAKEKERKRKEDRLFHTVMNVAAQELKRTAQQQPVPQQPVDHTSRFREIMLDGFGEDVSQRNKSQVPAEPVDFASRFREIMLDGFGEDISQRNKVTREPVDYKKEFDKLIGSGFRGEVDPRRRK